MREITINNKQYNIKYTLRALFIFELITNRPFEIKGILDNYLFFYCMILANNPDTPLDWDDFINALDENPNLFNDLNSVSSEANNREDLFLREDSSGEKKR